MERIFQQEKFSPFQPLKDISSEWSRKIKRHVGSTDFANLRENGKRIKKKKKNSTGRTQQVRTCGMPYSMLNTIRRHLIREVITTSQFRKIKNFLK